MSDTTTSYVVAEFDYDPTLPHPFTITHQVRVYPDQASATDFITARRQSIPERAYSLFTITTPTEWDQAAVTDYLTDLTENGLDGATIGDWLPDGALRWDIRGPGTTGHDGEYTVRDLLWGGTFGHSSDEPVRDGRYADLPADFEDSRVV